MTSPAQPTLTHAQLEASISCARLSGYARPDDQDTVDCVARYLWNMALAASAWQTIHVLEVTLRNVLYAVGKEQTASKKLVFREVESWLTADGMLQVKEQKDVEVAVNRLAATQKTEGHLIASLSFGFWVRLCNAPYEQGRKLGPGLWPAALKHFQWCPKHRRTRHGIRTEVGNASEFRNRIAHHHPIWDRRPDRRINEIVELVRWMNPPLAATLARSSQVAAIFGAGHEAYRERAALLVAA